MLTLRDIERHKAHTHKGNTALDKREAQQKRDRAQQREIREG
jgi:hypothetical protein